MKLLLSQIFRNRDGNVLPLAAIAIVLAAALVGGGIDMSRAYRVENRLQAACDSAVLAGRRNVGSNGYDTTAKTQASRYFTTNFDDATLETTGTNFTSASTDNGQTVTGSADTTLNMAVMQLFGFKKFSLSVECSASMGVGNSDVVMVLDTTGSMSTSLGSGTRITALRTAMKNFYTTVKNATAGTNARIRYGFVPYSSTVNVGRLLYETDPSYLVDTSTIQSRQMVTSSSTNDTSSTNTGSYQQHSSTRYTSSNNCNNALPNPNPTNWTNSGSPSSSSNNSSSGTSQTSVVTVTQQQVRTTYACSGSGSSHYQYSATQSRNYYTYTTSTMKYQPVTYDVSSFKAFASVSTNTGSYGAAVSSTWDGCIEERGSTNAASFSFSTTSGITPASAKDLDIDSAPTDDDSTKWRPMWPKVAYIRETSGGNLTNSSSSNYGDSVNSYCPYRSQLLTEMSQGSFNSYADALKAEGSTYLDVGMTWGGRLSSPDGIFSDNVKLPPSNGGEVSRHIIFMTDGIMEPNYGIQSAWGIEWHDRRVTSDGYSNDASRHTSRFLAVCEAIKAKAIRIWAISFTAGTSSSLQACASTDSYFNANDSAELNEAFQEIAKQVGELRIVQ